MSERAPRQAEEGPLLDRELSWLSFNARVLQEAADPDVPLFERLAFLGIFSSNLDEFFRVRVAALRDLLRLRRRRVKRLRFDPEELLGAIHAVVARQQEAFGTLFREQLRPALQARGIRLITARELEAAEKASLRSVFAEQVRPHLHPVLLATEGPPPFLADRSLHLAVELHAISSVPVAPEPPSYALVCIPSPPLERFVRLPGPADGCTVLFLDDVVRFHVADLFPGKRVGGAWCVKLSRDADLHLEDQFEGDVVEALERALRKRPSGIPTRFLYDPAMPAGALMRLQRRLELEPEDLVEGGRYHNLHDLRAFPRCGVEGEAYPPWPPLAHPVLDQAPTVREALDVSNHLLHFPYQSYAHVVRFLTEAAGDPAVEEIWLTVYRVSPASAVLHALLEAAERGKRVRVFVEVTARFDEQANLAWAHRLEEAGIVTLYSFADIKVHAKLALVVRRDAAGRRAYAYLGTGNFNEQTARYYTDMGLLTADPALTDEVERVFRFLAGDQASPRFEHLMVAPFDLRERLYALIEQEIERATRGEDARITFKLNALEDEEMIRHLYEAARSGVRLRGVVRGICRMVPEESVGSSEGVEIRSIVDRYLEHTRVYVFHRGGDPAVWLSSADWMHRNLSHRVEVAFPIRDPALRAEVLDVLGLQLADNRKARVLDAEGRNPYATDDGEPLRAQEAIRAHLERLSRSRSST